MMPLQNVKEAIMIQITSVTNAATTTGYVDCLGFDECRISLEVATSDSTGYLTTLALMESEDTYYSNATNITALVGGGTGGFDIPLSNTSIETLKIFDVDTRDKARYLFLAFSGLTTQLISARALLARAEDLPTTAATMGAAQADTASSVCDVYAIG